MCIRITWRTCLRWKYLGQYSEILVQQTSLCVALRSGCSCHAWSNQVGLSLLVFRLSPQVPTSFVWHSNASHTGFHKVPFQMLLILVLNRGSERQSPRQIPVFASGFCNSSTVDPPMNLRIFAWKIKRVTNIYWETGQHLSSMLAPNVQVHSNHEQTSDQPKSRDVLQNNRPVLFKSHV